LGGAPSCLRHCLYSIGSFFKADEGIGGKRSARASGRGQSGTAWVLLKAGTKDSIGRNLEKGGYFIRSFHCSEESTRYTRLLLTRDRAKGENCLKRSDLCVGGTEAKKTEESL